MLPERRSGAKVSMKLHGFRSLFSTVSLLCLATPPVGAEPTSTTKAVDNAGTQMPNVEVKGSRPGASVYTRNQIDTTPQGNRDLTSLLTDQAAVRLNPSTDTAGNRGSLAPLVFSIHGESPYQNQFLIDGISGTNLISPQTGSTGLQVGRVPGFAQAYNLDTALLEQVRVYDSMIPVEFGRFTGGVVDARIRNPRGTNSVALTYRQNGSNLTEQRIAPAANEDWQNGEPGYAAIWRKRFVSGQADVRLTDRTTALLSLSHRESLIRRQQMVLDRSSEGPPSGKNTVLRANDEADRVDNLLAKLRTEWGGGTESSMLLKWSDRQEQLVSNAFADSAWTNRQTAVGFSGEVVHPLGWATLTARLGHDQLDNLRRSNGTEFVTQQFATPGLTSYTYGGFGTESLKQGQTTARVQLDGRHFQTGPVGHRLYGGVEWMDIDARFVRDQDSYSYRAVLQTNGTQRYFNKVQYLAGEADVGVQNLSLYLSDTLSWRNLDLAASVRADRDDFFKNTNIAPRTRLGWDVFGDGHTQLALGSARYYGVDLLEYALLAEKSRLKRQLISPTGAPVDTTAPEQHVFDGVHTPYTDESALSWTQRLGHWLEGRLSFVHRDSRDGVTRTGTATTGYRYTNEARGRTDTTALTLSPLRPWYAGQAHWHGRLTFSWQKRRVNTNTVEAWESESYRPDDIVQYNGQLVPYKDLPAREFNQPREITLGFTGDWRALGLTWGNRMKWYSARTGVAYIGSTRGVDRYASTTLPGYWTWDTTLTHKPTWAWGLTLGVEVLNVLNKINTVAITNPTAATNRNAFNTGREIWLTAGYAF